MHVIFWADLSAQRALHSQLRQGRRSPHGWVLPQAAGIPWQRLIAGQDAPICRMICVHGGQGGRGYQLPGPARPQVWRAVSASGVRCLCTCVPTGCGVRTR